MEQRTCPSCGTDFTPTTHNQRYCPPTDEDRARWKGQARSRCANRAANIAARGAPLTLHVVGEPFDCAWCGLVCTPGENVVPHASRFCCDEHKKRWHKEHVEHPAVLLASFTAEPRRKEDVAYRRAMCHDPCVYCGAPSRDLDHIVPKSNGGADDSSNRAASCGSCNQSKQDVPMLIFLGWKRAREEFEPWRQIVAAHCYRRAAA